MYNNYYFRGQFPQQLLPAATVDQQIQLGRTGHYFSSMIPGYGQGQVTWQLLGMDSNGMVQMNINGQYTQVSREDIVGLTYLGPTPPPRPQPQQPTGGGGFPGGGGGGFPGGGGGGFPGGGGGVGIYIPGFGWIYR